MQQNPGVDERHARPCVAAREREIPERPGKHAHQYDDLDAEPAQNDGQQQHEGNFRHLSEGLDERRFRHLDLVQKRVREGVVELQRNAQQE